MRQIKFRGKRLKDGVWIQGCSIVKLGNGAWISDFTSASIRKSEFFNLFTEVDPATVGQYWCAINGKELFDGDIFRFKVGDKYIVRLVRYSENQAAFCIVNPSQLKHEEWMEIEQTPDASWWKEFVKDIEIIGNIHDNPELLKTE